MPFVEMVKAGGLRGTLEAMLLTPAGPAPIFAGKALAAAALLASCELVLLPAMAVFLGTPLSLAVFAAVRMAAPLPALVCCTRTVAPAAFACTAVSSVEPSSTTTTGRWAAVAATTAAMRGPS